jgi:RNA polymerase sigma-70 factor (ECF subfamily)
MNRGRTKTILRDEELIKSAIDGNTNAFKALVVKYESQVAKTVIGMLGNCHETDDIGQETFIRFYKSLGSFRGESSLSTYLTRIAINLSLNELKRRKRRSFFFQFKKSEDLEKISYERTDIELNETKEIVHYAIQKLEPQFRAVIVLRLIDSYSIKEISEILNVPKGTVSSRIARAQKKLRGILLPMMGGHV